MFKCATNVSFIITHFNFKRVYLKLNKLKYCAAQMIESILISLMIVHINLILLTPSKDNIFRKSIHNVSFH